MKKTLPKRYFKLPKSETIAIPTLKFPSISLNIPDKVLRKTLLSPAFLVSFTCSFLFMAIGIVSYDMRNNMAKLEHVKSERLRLEAQINYWKGVVSQYKGHRDGLYQLAVLEYRAGNLREAYEYSNKALSIDPDFKDAKVLGDKIVGK